MGGKGSTRQGAVMRRALKAGSILEEGSDLCTGAPGVWLPGQGSGGQKGSFCGQVASTGAVRRNDRSAPEILADGQRWQLGCARLRDEGLIAFAVQFPPPVLALGGG